jgi:hypothetical protein
MTGAALMRCYVAGERDFDCTDLRGANLPRAHLRGVSLVRASLSWANLHCADLQKADLREANLRGADLVGAGLRHANLHEADLGCAMLSGADLRGADLSRANLRWSILDGRLGRADVRDTCLDPAAPVPRPASWQIKGSGLQLVRFCGVEYLIGWYAPSCHGEGECTDYSAPGEYVAPWFSVDCASDDHPGIYFAGPGGQRAVRGFCRLDEALCTHTGKWRCKRWRTPNREGAPHA